jgi:hypothetical protein
MAFGKDVGVDRMKKANRCLVLLCQHHGAIEGAVGIGREIRCDEDSVETTLALVSPSSLGSGISGPSAN